MILNLLSCLKRCLILIKLYNVQEYSNILIAFGLDDTFWGPGGIKGKKFNCDFYGRWDSIYTCLN